MADEETNSLIAEFEHSRHAYEVFSAKLKTLFEDLLREAGIDTAGVEARAKTVESLRGKLDRKRQTKQLIEVTDLSGLRIITYYIEDAERVREIIHKEFKVEDTDLPGKSELSEPDRFGYLSSHYVVSLHDSRANLPEWKPLAGLKAEIQVRTVLQHAWAAIDHKLRYKATREIPSPLARRLFRLSALLELADEEFSEVRKTALATIAGYSKDLKLGRLDIETNLDSLDTYLQATGMIDKWAERAVAAGFVKVTESGRAVDLRRLLNVTHQAEMIRIAELDEILRQADSWGSEALRDIRLISEKGGFTPIAVPEDIISIIVMLAKVPVVAERVARKAEFRDQLSRAIGQVALGRRSRSSA